ncbi:MAG: purine-binding chemotaxis protein CheW [Verrucomicrobia bacterium]|nr:purine-binding chemotaxis protein CheW [Verrucomicrobiota bacterium]MBI3870054.1 purine-binding chemotaxis protein CheW [Verrucomicrobiota bacterium]
MATETAGRGAAAHPAASGKYLTFTLGEESYGIGVLKVREIIRVPDITSVPQMPDYVKGVMNLRGKVIPVADLRVKFRLSNIQNTERTCVVVVQVQQPSGSQPLIGLIVDAVEEVVNIPSTDIEPTPDFGTGVDTHYIVGMAKVKGVVKTLIDLDRVVATEPIAVMSAVAHAR